MKCREKWKILELFHNFIKLHFNFFLRTTLGCIIFSFFFFFFETDVGVHSISYLKRKRKADTVGSAMLGTVWSEIRSWQPSPHGLVYGIELAYSPFSRMIDIQHVCDCPLFIILIDKIEAKTGYIFRIRLKLQQMVREKSFYHRFTLESWL